MSESSGGGRAVLMIVVAALLLAAVGWGVDVVVRRVEQELPRPAPSPAPRPEPTPRHEPTPQPASPPAPVAPPEDETLRKIHEEFDRRAAELDKSLAESKAEAERIGGDVRPPVALQSPAPQYTEAARRARVQGVVILEATVSREGKVVSTRVLKGLPMGLDEAAREAVAAWRFTPATRDGEPVDVIITLTINFRLE